MLPTYTQTGVPITLTHAAVATGAPDPGNGWYAAQDTAGAWTAVGGCGYPEYVSDFSQLVSTAAWKLILLGTNKVTTMPPLRLCSQLRGVQADREGQLLDARFQRDFWLVDWRALVEVS